MTIKTRIGTVVALILACCLFQASTAAETNCANLKLDDETRNLIKEIIPDKWLKKDVILGGILAALAGFAVQAYEARRKRKEDVRFNENLLGALRRELEALREIYDQNIGGILKKLPENKPLEVRFSLTENWFAVFESNAGQLGRFETGISRQIIAVYTQLKYLIEEFRVNNVHLDELEAFRRKPDLKLDYCLWEKEAIDKICAQTSRIRRADKNLKSAVEQFFETLTKIGIE
jgi:hypothetical protein